MLPPLLNASCSSNGGIVYGFDFVSGSCIQMNNGGCQTNRNYFSTMASCQASCATRSVCDDILAIETWMLFNWDLVNSTLVSQVSSWSSVVQSANGSFATFFNYIVSGLHLHVSNQTFQVLKLLCYILQPFQANHGLGVP